MIFRVLATLLGMLIASYLFFVAHITFSVLERKTAETNMQHLTASESSLELQYLSLDQSVDLNMAHALGYKDAPAALFAANADAGATLGFKMP